MATAYDSAFFSIVADDSLKSARVIVPMVMELLAPKSVLDVGCGPGAWLRAFVENGVRVIQGIDGDYVERGTLLIDPRYFVAADLTKSISLDREYDLALCIEVGEHLPPRSAAALIEKLTSAAPAVLFSAAIPGQGGTNHVNEQWPEYWRDLFARRDFVMFDPFRPRIRDDPRIAFWVRQNLLLFVSNVALASYPRLRGQFGKTEQRACEWVHVNFYEKWFREATRTRGVKEILRDLPSAIGRSIRRLKQGSRLAKMSRL